MLCQVCLQSVDMIYVILFLIYLKHGVENRMEGLTSSHIHPGFGDWCFFAISLIGAEMNDAKIIRAS